MSMASRREHDGLAGSYELTNIPTSERSTPVQDDTLHSLGQESTYKTASPPGFATTIIHSLAFWRPKKDASVTKRNVPLRFGGELLVDEQTGYPYVSNRISTARYTIWTFFPRQIVYQFSRMANAYFLVIAILQLIPGFSTTGRFSTLIPLVIFVALTIAKEGYDDWKRYTLDKEENARRVSVLRAPGGQAKNEKENSDTTSALKIPLAESSQDWKTIKWEDLVVGDVVRISKDEEVPADLVLLYADQDVAYVDTRALDGETTLKSKSVSPALKGLGLDALSASAALTAREVVFTIELPNQDLYNFDGTVTASGEDSKPLNLDNIIYRGCELKNTNHMIGLVLNTGEDTKIRMNANRNATEKRPALEKLVDLVVISLAMYMLTTSLILYMAFKIFWNPDDLPWYLNNGNVEDAPIVIGFIIQYSNVVPMSIIMAIEAVKLNLSYWVFSDLEMYHEETDCPAGCNTNSVIDDLGQIGYVFTDKTGTLTDNVMKFRRLCVAGTSWWHNDHRSTAEENVSPTPEDLTTDDLVAHIRENPSSSFSNAARKYILALAICHTCLPEYDSMGNFVDFQASSPDELALVRAAQELGILVVERSTTSITIHINAAFEGQQRQETYEILDVIEFSSKRKRMSIIVRRPDGRLWLVCKGADSVVLPLLRISPQDRRLQLVKSHEKGSTRLTGRSGGRWSQELVPSPDDAEEIEKVEAAMVELARDTSDPDPYARRSHEDPDLDRFKTLQQCCDQIDAYAREGLRTLVFADRFLSEQEYKAWKQRYREAQVSMTDRQKKLEEVGEQVERGFDLIGASGVEDKLQKGVPETIDRLRRANIKIWMLTGDKRETAINIAHSSHICNSSTSLFQLDVEDGDLEWQISDIINSPEHGDAVHTALVIDGATLTAIEAPGASHLRKVFYTDLVPKIQSVICCRASPSQKALLVQAVRDGDLKPSKDASIFARAMWWGKSAITNHLKPLTLAIGDGANDLAMITSANVGVGISGREGQQAARVADVSIAQFRFLSRLLLVHGRWNYHRITRFLLGSFWKETMCLFPAVLYQISNGFTGTSPYESSALTVYGVMFTIASTMALGVWEKDLKARTLMAVPELYAYGQKAMGLNWGVLFAWMLNALLAGTAISFIAWAGYGGAFTLTPDDNGLYAIGTLVFISCVVWVNVKLLIIEMQYKTILALAVFAIQSLFLVWAFHIVLGYVLPGLVISPYFVVDGFTYTFGRDLAWWATLGLIFGVLIVMEVSIETLRQRFTSQLTRLFGREKREWDPRLWKEIERDPHCKRRLEEMAYPT